MVGLCPSPKFCITYWQNYVHKSFAICLHMYELQFWVVQVRWILLVNACNEYVSFESPGRFLFCLFCFFLLFTECVFFFFIIIFLAILNLMSNSLTFFFSILLKCCGSSLHVYSSFLLVLLIR